METDDDPPVDGWDAPRGLAEHVHRQANTYLATQVDLAKAADQRAVAAASIFAAVAAGLFGWAINQDQVRDGLALAVTAAGLMAAAGLCIKAAWPRDFFAPGAEPRSWWGETGGTLAEGLRSELEAMQGSINANSAALVENAKFAKFGLCAAPAAVAVGFVVWFLLALAR